MPTYYKELVDRYLIETTQGGLEGTRAFYEDANGTLTLPALNSAFKKFNGSTISNLRARRLRETIFAPSDNRSTWKPLIVVSYSTNASGGGKNGAAGITSDPDQDERRFDLGGEIITVREPAGWTWSVGGNTVDQPMFIANVMGTFTIKKTLTSDADKKTWLQDKVIPLAGTINDREFEDFRTGQVLFSGINGGTQYDEVGDRTWVFELNFTFRVLKGGRLVNVGGINFAADVAGGAIRQDDWLYLWNKAPVSGGASAGWDKPVDANNNNPLYASSNLADVL